MIFDKTFTHTEVDLVNSSRMGVQADCGICGFYIPMQLAYIVQGADMLEHLFTDH